MTTSFHRTPSPTFLATLLLSALVAHLSVAAEASTPTKPSADLILTHAYIVTMNAKKDLIEDGAVIIKDAHIIAVGPSSIAANYIATKTIDAGGDIAMPGMINTHTHVSMTLFRGLGDDVPDRLKRFIFPLEKNLVDRQLVYWGGLYGMIEMVQGGVTTFVDMYYFEDEVAKATRKIGLRGILGESVMNFASPDSPEPYGGIAYAKKFIQEYRSDPLITPAFAPHAPYTVDAEHLKLIEKEADALDVPVVMHVAEMTDEVATIRKDFNKTVIEYLDSIGVLNRRLIAAHCIFVNDSDIALLKARDVGIAHNMVANIKSAKGVSPALKMFDDGARVGLGTDGPMSGNTLDIIGQLGYVAKVTKLDRKDRNVMPAIKVVEMATMGGARAIHRENELGSLEVGKLADVVVINHEDTTMIPFYDVYSTLVYAATAQNVRSTIIHGRVVMEDRKITTVDVAEVKKEMRAISTKITTALAQGLK